LILVVLADADRMMRVVHLGEEVRDGQLHLMGPQQTTFIFGREAVTAAEKQQDVRGLRDDELASFEIRRRERNRAWMRAVERSVERLFAAAFVLGQARDINVRDGCVLERQPHEFAAPLNRRPVMQLVLHATEYAP